MKRTIFAAVLCLLIAGCSPLKISMDSRTEDGGRMVYTSDKHLFSHMDVALGAKINGRDTVLAVIITSRANTNHGIFDKGDEMKFRLSDQSVITLTNIYHKEFEKETSTNITRDRVDSYGYAYAYDPYTADIFVAPYEVSSFIPRTHVTTTTKSYALYFISKPQLQDIIDKGVIKLRVEIEDDELDMRDTEKVSELFGDLKACLYERISHPKERKEF